MKSLSILKNKDSFRIYISWWFWNTPLILHFDYSMRYSRLYSWECCKRNSDFFPCTPFEISLNIYLLFHFYRYQTIFKPSCSHRTTPQDTMIPEDMDLGNHSMFWWWSPSLPSTNQVSYPHTITNFWVLGYKTPNTTILLYYALATVGCLCLTLYYDDYRSAMTMTQTT